MQSSSFKRTARLGSGSKLLEQMVSVQTLQHAPPNLAVANFQMVAFILHKVHTLSVGQFTRLRFLVAVNRQCA